MRATPNLCGARCLLSFSPLCCSMTSRVSFRELQPGIAAQPVEVGAPQLKDRFRLRSGRNEAGDFRSVPFRVCGAPIEVPAQHDHQRHRCVPGRRTMAWPSMFQGGWEGCVGVCGGGVAVGWRCGLPARSCAGGGPCIAAAAAATPFVGTAGSPTPGGHLVDTTRPPPHLRPLWLKINIIEGKKRK